MIKKLRQKFIMITMSSLIAVLLLIITVINIFNIYQNTSSVDNIARIILENNGQFPKNNLRPNEKPKEDIPGEGFLKGGMHNKNELPFTTRFFTVTVDNNGNIQKYNLDNIASVSKYDLEDYVKAAQGGIFQSGIYHSYRYICEERTEGTMIVFVEASRELSQILSVFFITVIVGIITVIIVLIPVLVLSSKAIRPISETYEKQKSFITDVSHELKTPLTVIAANTEIIELTYGKNEWTDGVLRQTDKMRSLIQKMIELTRLDEENLLLTKQDFNIGDAVYDTAKSFEGVAKSKNLQLNIYADDILYSGDESSIRQLTAILVDNAVKYCESNGEIEVSVKKHSKGINKEKILISVSNGYNNGKELDTDKIFERFYRSDKSRSETAGYGLGLPIAKAIVEKHNGSINAKIINGKIEFSVIL